MSAPQVRRKIRLADFIRGNCAKSTAHKWINEGKLRAFKVGAMTFVDETFDEFVERQDAERRARLQERPATTVHNGAPLPLAAQGRE